METSTKNARNRQVSRGSTGNQRSYTRGTSRGHNVVIEKVLLYKIWRKKKADEAAFLIDRPNTKG